MALDTLINNQINGVTVHVTARKKKKYVYQRTGKTHESHEIGFGYGK